MESKKGRRIARFKKRKIPGQRKGVEYTAEEDYGACVQSSKQPALPLLNIREKKL